MAVLVHAGFRAFGCVDDLALTQSSATVAATRALPYLHELAAGSAGAAAAKAEAVAIAASLADAEAGRRRRPVDVPAVELEDPPEGLVTVQTHHHCQVCEVRYRSTSSMVFGEYPVGPIVKAGLCPMCARILRESQDAAESPSD